MQSTTWYSAIKKYTMPDNITKVNKETVISLGVVITIFSAIAGGLIWGGKISERVSGVEKDVVSLEEKLSNLPTRAEFNSLIRDVQSVKENIQGVKQGVDEVNQFLRQ